MEYYIWFDVAAEHIMLYRLNGRKLEVQIDRDEWISSEYTSLQEMRTEAISDASYKIIVKEIKL